MVLIHTNGSQPVHSNTCEAGPSLGPAGVEIGRSLLQTRQEQHGIERRARLDVQAPAVDGQPSAGEIPDGRVIVEEEDEAEPAETAAAAQTHVGTATMSTRSKSISSRGNNSSSQHPSTPIPTVQQDQQAKKVGSGPAQLGGRQHQHGNMLVAEEAYSAEQPEGRKDRPHMGRVFLGLVTNMSRWCQQVPSLASHTWTSMYEKGTRWRQQVPSLASRTWTSVYAKRAGPDAMIAILAVFVIAALVCGWFVAYCREPARRHDRRLRTVVGGNRHLTLPASPRTGGRASNRGSHSNSPAGCSSMPVTWSRSMNTHYSGSISSD